jgi:FtsH-binding integral membrane protein
LLGLALLAVGLVGWCIGILVGVEKDRSLAGISLAFLYVLSFGLGGGVLGLLRRQSSRWRQSVIAWGAAIVIVLLGCGVMTLLLESGRPIEWFWGAGSAAILCALLVISWLQIRKQAGGGDA